MIACTIAGGVPNVGGISAASTTPSRPLVPAPTKMMRPPRRSASVSISMPCARRSRSRWTAVMTLRSSAIIRSMMSWHGRLVEVEAVGIDCFGGKDFPFGLRGHNPHWTPRNTGRRGYYSARSGCQFPTGCAGWHLLRLLTTATPRLTARRQSKGRAPSYNALTCRPRSSTPTSTTCAWCGGWRITPRQLSARPRAAGPLRRRA